MQMKFHQIHQKQKPLHRSHSVSFKDCCNQIQHGDTAQHYEALNKLKEEILSHLVLAHYDVHAGINFKISANNSSHGVGAVLQSQDGTTWQSMALTSRALR